MPDRCNVALNCVKVESNLAGFRAVKKSLAEPFSEKLVEVKMTQLVKKFFISASVLAGLGAIAPAPSLAASITGASIGGTAPYLTYSSGGGHTFTVANTQGNVQAALDGDSSVPGGNVELFSNSEQSSLSPSLNTSISQTFTSFYNFLGYNQYTSLSGQIGGQDITLSSLMATDWFGQSAVNSVKTAIANASAIANPIAKAIAFSAAIAPLYNSANLATQWFNQALSNYGFTSNQQLFNIFLLAGGFQRFSDPNISYVNQDGETIKIGLAGHYDALALLGIPPIPGLSLQASELVKVVYGAKTEYKYSFKATRSGLTALGDGISHRGNYEVAVEAVPEPTTMLGLILGGGSLIAAKRKSLKKA